MNGSRAGTPPPPIGAKSVWRLVTLAPCMCPIPWKCSRFTSSTPPLSARRHERLPRRNAPPSDRGEKRLAPCDTCAVHVSDPVEVQQIHQFYAALVGEKA